MPKDANPARRKLAGRPQPEMGWYSGKLTLFAMWPSTKLRSMRMSISVALHNPPPAAFLVCNNDAASATCAQTHVGGAAFVRGAARGGLA